MTRDAQNESVELFRTKEHFVYGVRDSVDTMIQGEALGATISHWHEAIRQGYDASRRMAVTIPKGWQTAR